MTAFAFILGCAPLWFADGSGALSRKSLGTTVISGMLASTIVEIFLVPVIFVVVETIASKLGGHKKGGVAPGGTVHGGAA
jgi:HAE1 family hydrophobic/amphiphilic exporter-1